MLNHLSCKKGIFYIKHMKYRNIYSMHIFYIEINVEGIKKFQKLNLLYYK